LLPTETCNTLTLNQQSQPVDDKGPQKATQLASLGDLNFDHLIGREVGTAVLLKELARGGMAVVFIAYQKTLKRQIAVKILPKVLLSPLTAALFQQEAESAAILAHPNIVPIYEVGETEDFLFFTMQLVKGLSLQHHIGLRRKHLLPSRRIAPLQESVKIIMSCLDALGCAHDQGIIHRDMKPANVLIEQHTGRPMITDFGVARISRGLEISASMIVGTPRYMPPEQISGAEADARADIYSLGIMLFELVAGNLPLPEFNSSRELIQAKLALKDRFFQQKASGMNPSVGPEMDRIIFNATAFDPEQRYVSCREFIRDLSAYQSL
jgi:eukaryotic-like serine/threonine-protein kinase